MTNFGFETLLKEKNLLYDYRWSPHSVQQFSNLFKNGILKDMNYRLTKNIVYSMQYLEYIDFQIKSLKLHSIIQKMLYKTFIITAISIIEAIFLYILKTNGKNTKNTKELVFTTTSNEKKTEKDTYIIQTNIFKVIEPQDEQMTLDTMIKKMENGKFLDLEHEYFPYLKKLKLLRNHVHISITPESERATDYYNFNNTEYFLIKYVLLNVLLDEKIQLTDKMQFDGDVYRTIPNEYNFLLISIKEMEILKKEYKL